MPHQNRFEFHQQYFEPNGPEALDVPKYLTLLRDVQEDLSITNKHNYNDAPTPIARQLWRFLLCHLEMSYGLRLHPVRPSVTELENRDRAFIDVQVFQDIMSIKNSGVFIEDTTLLAIARFYLARVEDEVVTFYQDRLSSLSKTDAHDAALAVDYTYDVFAKIDEQTPGSRNQPHRRREDVVYVYSSNK